MRRNDRSVGTEGDVLHLRQITLAEGKTADLIAAINLENPGGAVLTGGRQEPTRRVEGERGDATVMGKSGDLLAVLDAQQSHHPLLAAGGQDLSVRTKCQGP